ncbi:hypothetical protein ANN_01319 [Periplaneta americana]|uniref:Uncharacterized protein n=1 Tax=Periplaneta americana TaxID=6978 RepID=A0ABQ8TW51_PERAM|nr:hypothetical protein ANN_01319 [Periplaneta americana]
MNMLTEEFYNRCSTYSGYGPMTGLYDGGDEPSGFLKVISKKLKKAILNHSSFAGRHLQSDAEILQGCQGQKHVLDSPCYEALSGCNESILQAVAVIKKGSKHYSEIVRSCGKLQQYLMINSEMRTSEQCYNKNPNAPNEFFPILSNPLSAHKISNPKLTRQILSNPLSAHKISNPKLTRQILSNPLSAHKISNPKLTRQVLSNPLSAHKISNPKLTRQVLSNSAHKISLNFCKSPLHIKYPILNLLVRYSQISSLHIKYPNQTAHKISNPKLTRQVSKYTPAQLVYVMERETFLLEDLRTKLLLPSTTSYEELLQELQTKKTMI